MKNLFGDIPEELPGEFFEALAQSEDLLIERIVSRGHHSPATGWFDQPRHEFVVLLSGAARLEFEDGRRISMQPGDWLSIAPHERHRVAWTAPETDSVWLAVHFARGA
jgi:cupin 2 domain-containing protein